MNLNKYYNFNSILTINIDELNNSSSITRESISEKWLLILISDGSFTQNLNSLIGKSAKLNIYDKSKINLLNQKKISVLFG